jgi:hypothetical protein
LCERAKQADTEALSLMKELSIWCGPECGEVSIYVEDVDKLK